MGYEPLIKLVVFTTNQIKNSNNKKDWPIGEWLIY